MENDGKSEVSSEYNAVMFQEIQQVNPGFSSEKPAVSYKSRQYIHQTISRLF